jgi:hypothetical protein
MQLTKIELNNIIIYKSCLDIIKNTLPGDINIIIFNYLEEGKNIYNKNIISHPDICKYGNWDLIYDNWSYSIYFTCNLLYFENIKIKCFITNKVISSIYSNTLSINHGNVYYYTYYLFSEGENSCILFYGGPYNVPMLIYYIKKNIYYNLIFAPLGGPYNSNYYENMINILISTEYDIIKSIIDDSTYIDQKKNYNRNNCIYFANNFQAGHYLWNEVSGLDILIRTKLINNIDTILLGNYDICNIHKIFKEYNPLCNIISVNDKYKYNKFNNFGFISGHFILNKTKELYLKYITPIKLNNKFIIIIFIKADRRCLYDCDNVYIQLINKLVENNILKPNETIILFDGLYNNDNNLFLSNYYNNYKDKYINIIDNIIKNIDKNIECKSLIGLKFYEILPYYYNVNFWIGVQSSTIEIIQQINKNGVIIMPITLLYTIEQQCCYIEDRINHPKVISKYENDLIIIDFNEFYNTVKNYIEKLLI